MHNCFRLCLLGTVLISGIVVSGSEGPSVFETVRNSNAAILNRLGLVPLEIPGGHHKKRLAGPEPPAFGPQSRIHQYSRRHGHRDSHVYIVKLPASPPYYTFTKPHKSVKDEKGLKNAGNLPVGFHSNGKPAKIYHWNLPLMMKIAEKKQYHQLKMDQLRKDQLKKDQLIKKVQFEKSNANSEISNIKVKSNEMNVLGSIGKNDVLDRRNEIDQAKKLSLTDNDNRLLYGSKPMKSLAKKQSRNNDKRLSYPNLEAGLKKLKEESPGKNKTRSSNITNKMFRLADSTTYRVGAQNDRFSWNNLSNELHGSRNTPDDQKPKKHRKKAAMSYYAPNPNSGSNSIHKNFAGNGKPKAFYVMEKGRKPIYHHQLLP